MMRIGGFVLLLGSGATNGAVAVSGLGVDLATSIVV